MCARILASSAWLSLAVVFFLSPLSASNHYTEKQLEALATRVKNTYWVVAADGRTPSFLSAPSAGAQTFSVDSEASFEITELVGRKTKNPYYKVRFASGKEGYLRIETFIEEFNATILAMDPRAEEKKKLAAAAEEEEARIAWIRARPWSDAVKEAAIRRRPVLGMKTAEIKRVLGEPARVVTLRGRQHVTEEQWIYDNGPTLTFTNGLLTKAKARAKTD